MSRARYVAMYETGERGQNYLRFANLEFEEGFIPPPLVNLGVPLNGIHEFTYVGEGTQAQIANLFGTSQQNVGRWLKNKPPQVGLMSDWGRSEWQAKPNQAALRRLAEQEAARAAMSAPRKVHAAIAVAVLMAVGFIVAALVVL